MRDELSIIKEGPANTDRFKNELIQLINGITSENSVLLVIANKKNECIAKQQIHSYNIVDVIQLFDKLVGQYLAIVKQQNGGEK